MRAHACAAALGKESTGGRVSGWDCRAREQFLLLVCPSEGEDEFLLPVFLMVCSEAISGI